MLRIQDAIAVHNMSKNPEDRINQGSLGEKVCPESVHGGRYLSLWKKDKELRSMSPDHVERICNETGVDANFLYDWRGDLLPGNLNPKKIRALINYCSTPGWNWGQKCVFVLCAELQVDPNYLFNIIEMKK